MTLNNNDKTVETEISSESKPSLTVSPVETKKVALKSDEFTSFKLAYKRVSVILFTLSVAVLSGSAVFYYMKNKYETLKENEEIADVLA